MKGLKNIYFKILFVNVTYLSIINFLIGVKFEHIFISVLCSFLFLYNAKTKKFILAFGLFVIFGVVYDLMRAFPNYKFNNVDIVNIHNLEKFLFGIQTNLGKLTPCEYFSINHNSLFDFLSGFFYINWMSVPLAFAFYLYLKNKEQFLKFSLVFILTNFLGFVIYYIHPAAPPWYFKEYGANLIYNTQGNPAGLVRFDELLNVKVFHAIYSKNANVFAALPSLHSAYPVIVFYYALKNIKGYFNILFGVFMIGIWFSAVYSGHHYLIDVSAGVLCAVIGIYIFEIMLIKSNKTNILFEKYCKIIS